MVKKLKNFEKYIWTILIFIIYLLINHFYFVNDMRQDLSRRYLLLVSINSCGDLEYLIAEKGNMFANIYLQMKHLSDFVTCRIFIYLKSELITFYILPSMLGSIIFYLMVTLFKKLSTNPIPYKTFLLILIIPPISFSMGEHFKSNIGIIFLLIALIIEGKKKKYLIYFLSFLSHVTSIFTIFAYKIMSEKKKFNKILLVLLFFLLALFSNYVYSISIKDEIIQIDFQTTLILIYGVILSVQSISKSFIIKIDLMPMLLIIILGSILGGGRYIISALPLLLFYASLKNENIWLLLFLGGLLSFIPFASNLSI